MFVVVRHAHAGNKKLWTGSDAERPLSPFGREQARFLATALAEIDLHTVRSSPTARCRQTVAPLAATRGLPIDDEPLLAVDAPIDRLYELLTGTDMDGVLLCTHGEVFRELITVARSHEDWPRSAPDSTEKGAAWIVDPSAAPRHRLRYIPPSPVGNLTALGAVVIRPLTPGDDDAVRHLHERLDHHNPGPPRRTGLPGIATVLPAQLRRPDGHHLGIGAFAGGTVVGLAHCTLVEAETGAEWVADCTLVVDHDAQYHGIGAALVRQLTARACALGALQARARVPAANTALLEVLHSLGWSRTGPAGPTVEMTCALSGSGPARLDR
ncbi:GNAT family N-acetyltransferase [Rhodococcus aetherivorans]|uniref:GNAT family N-acetyltransferase n=1 Tax=Rhodococcus aetherivorans TaxID=191292 RepID=UPI00311AB448